MNQKSRTRGNLDYKRLRSITTLQHHLVYIVFTTLQTCRPVDANAKGHWLRRVHKRPIFYA